MPFQLIRDEAIALLSIMEDNSNLLGYVRIKALIIQSPLAQPLDGDGLFSQTVESPLRSLKSHSPFADKYSVPLGSSPPDSLFWDDQWSSYLVNPM